MRSASRIGPIAPSVPHRQTVRRTSTRGFAEVLERAAAAPSPSRTAHAAAPATATPPMATFDSLFETVQVQVQPGYGESYTLRRTMCATAEAAQEALRLVQKYEPAASVRQVQWGCGRPYLGDKPIREIVLPNGTRLNAGLVLAQYYQNGSGANPVTEAQLAEEVTGNRADG